MTKASEPSSFFFCSPMSLGNIVRSAGCFENIRDAGKLEKPLQDMGARHVGYGTAPEHYPVVRDTLVSVMADMAGEAWNDQLTQDWNGALDFVSSVMLEGAKNAVPAGQPN